MIQLVTYVISNSVSGLTSNSGLISLISGCLGVCSVCLTSQGNIWTYAFGFGQVLTYTYLCWTQRFYGEIAINAYYFGTMIYGVFVWKERMRSLAVRELELSGKEEKRIVTRRLKWQTIVLIGVATMLVSWLTGWGLAVWTDDTQPYLDAFTTIPALVAQVLMILVFCEHWYIWLAVDILSVVLWLRAGDYCMTAQYVFWCANCIYGLTRWRSLGISRE